jgi:hypothetical protein
MALTRQCLPLSICRLPALGRAIALPAALSLNQRLAALDAALIHTVRFTLGRDPKTARPIG